MTQSMPLLINFGTPRSPSCGDVLRYRSEILLDPCVPIPSILKKIFAHCGLRKATARYQSIWTAEGSPLLVRSRQLAAALSEHVDVEFAMRYGEPSIASVLGRLGESGVKEVVVLPLFPQEVPSITRGIWRQVERHGGVVSSVRMVSGFHLEPWYIRACAQRIVEACPGEYDHILFSFHGVPACESVPYRERCYGTALAIADVLGLRNISVSFQSRVGYGRWTQPYTGDELRRLLRNKKKRILISCPGFVVDGVETLGEVAGEYRSYVLRHGGEACGVVGSLNDCPVWVSGLASYVRGFL